MPPTANSWVGQLWNHRQSESIDCRVKNWLSVVGKPFTFTADCSQGFDVSSVKCTSTPNSKFLNLYATPGNVGTAGWMFRAIGINTTSAWQRGNLFPLNVSFFRPQKFHFWAQRCGQNCWCRPLSGSWVRKWDSINVPELAGEPCFPQ